MFNRLRHSHTVGLFRHAMPFGNSSSSRFVRGNQQGHPRGAVGGFARLFLAPPEIYKLTRPARRVNLEEKTNAQS